MKLLYPFWSFPEHRLRAFWRLMIHLIVTIFAILACAPFLFAMEMLGPDPSLSFVASAIAQSLALIIGCVICYVLIDRRRLSDLQLGRTFGRELLDGCLIGALLMSGILLVGLLAGWIRIERIGATSLQQWLVLLAWQCVWLMVMILVGISEEFFSRGQQLKNLAEGFRVLGASASVLLAIMASSLFFGLLHSGNPSATWVSTASVTGAGVMLAIARVYSGRLALPIGIHITWNYFQGPVFGFAVSGQETQNSLMEVTSAGPTWLTGGDFGPEAGALGIAAMCAGVAVIAGWRKLSSHTSSRSLKVEFLKLAQFKPLHRKRIRAIAPPEPLEQQRPTPDLPK